MSPLCQYAVAFALTCAVELPVYGALLAGAGGMRMRAVLLTALAVNVMSHPLLWLGMGRYQHSTVGYLVAFLVGEVLVCLIEGAVFAVALRRTLPRGLLWPTVVLANAVSAGLGLVIAVLG